MAGGVVFERRDGAAGGGCGDVVFCVAILCLSILSMIIFVAAGGGSDGSEGKRRRRSGGRAANGPVFVGGRGCGCGGCRAGAGVCGTYLS